MEQPHLFSKLRTALNYLYDSQQTYHRHDAHHFLLIYKQSNIRRLVVSRLQSRKDGGNELSFDQAKDLTGSIFLSCLALLYNSCGQNNSISHERIFTAQALNHRCRSIKLSEILDIEAEDGVEGGTARLVLALEDIKQARKIQSNNSADLNEKTKTILKAWLERYVPMLVNRCGGGLACSGSELLAVVLDRHSSMLLDSPYLGDESRGEEQIKGTLMMFSLAVAMYVAAFRDFEENHNNPNDEAKSPWANAVLSELGSSLAVIMLRIRYRPTVDKQGTPAPDPSCPPLIDALVHAINLVKDSATVYLTNKQSANNELPSQLQEAHHYAVRRSIAACLTSLPETVLLPPGQDYVHRIPSVDRGALRAASMELRCNETGMEKAMSVLMQSMGNTYDDSAASQLLGMCEAWARYVAVPIHVVEESVGKIAIQYMHISKGIPSTPPQQKVQSLAFQYLVALFEAALPSLSVTDILTAALGVGATGVQSGKKKQGNKSKKRNEKRLDRAKAVEDESSQKQAEEELLARKNAACAAAAAIFGVSTSDTGDDWGLRLASTCPSTTSHSICAAVAAAATSVLPHLLWLERNDGPTQEWRNELFSSIIVVIQRMCKSEHRETRALAYEALMILHQALNSVTFVSYKVEQIAIDSICDCALSLSASCAYPVNYFDNLHENNDEDLEIERNDVRDVCRSVCSLESGNYGNEQHKSPSVMILNRIVSACYGAIKDTGPTVLPSEAVVHALSALAKPLNKLGNNCLEKIDEEGCQILLKALDSFGDVFHKLNATIEQLPHSMTLPLSRLALIGFASLAPLMSSVAKMALRSTNEIETNLIQITQKTLCAGIQQSILSSARIPELIAESTLDSTRYDIKGAMRGPGGEDHVGCIALIRVSSESDELRNSIFKVCGKSILQDLTNLHHALKRIEVDRGVGIDYGCGVSPLSRRLLIRVISRLGMQQGDDSVLYSLLEEPLREIVSQKSTTTTIEKLFRLCEAALDLSFFSPEILSHLFKSRGSDLDPLFEALIMGYSSLSFTNEADASTYQWGRLRCGVFCLLRACQSVSDYSCGVLAALIKAECDSAFAQCGQGPQSGSNLFIDDVMGEEKIHTGAFVMLVGEYLKNSLSKHMAIEDQLESCHNCVKILKDCSPGVASVLLHTSPEASNHVDPRESLAEAWFLTMKTLASLCRHNEQIVSSLDAKSVQSLLGDSLSIAMLFIFLKDIGGKKRPQPVVQRGMTPDGPQTLAICEFMTESMLLGPSILHGGILALSSHLQLNITNEVPAEVLGAAAISASLLRAISGATPPWVVEDTPVLFKSMFTSLGSNPDLFIHSLGVSTKLVTLTSVGGLQTGEKLSGRYLEASDSHIDSFLSKARETVARNDWKKMKVILKSATGGKKKESGFNLKPHYSTWDCERI